MFDWSTPVECPKCGSKDTGFIEARYEISIYMCSVCGNCFEIEKDEYRKLKKMNIKKIIAREVLILLVVLSIGILFYSIGSILNYLKPQAEYPGLVCLNGYLLKRIGIVMLLIVYPLYWLIHFIHWAVRTLREK